MPKPNYRFDKRQRELKKAKEQEEKRLKKQSRDAESGLESAPEPGSDAEDSSATEPAPPSA